MLLQELNVWFRSVLGREELLVGRDGKGGCLDIWWAVSTLLWSRALGGKAPTFANSVQCADLRAILHLMYGKVNLGDGLLVGDGTRSIVQMLAALVGWVHLGGALPRTARLKAETKRWDMARPVKRLATARCQGWRCGRRGKAPGACPTLATPDTEN